MKVKKFMVGFEMLAQVQRDLTAEMVGYMNSIIIIAMLYLSAYRVLKLSGNYQMSTIRKGRVVETRAGTVNYQFCVVYKSLLNDYMINLLLLLIEC